MKKLIFLTLFCVNVSWVSAQFIVSGQFNFGVASEKEGDSDDRTSATLVTVQPRLAFARGKWVFGGDVGATLLARKEEFGIFERRTNTTLFTVGPFARRVWRPVDAMGVWLEGQVSATFGASEENDDKTADYFNLYAGIRPGVIFFIGRHLSFEASYGRLGFARGTVTYPTGEEKQSSSQFGLLLNDNAGTASLLDGSAPSSGFLFGVNYQF